MSASNATISRFNRQAPRQESPTQDRGLVIRGLIDQIYDHALVKLGDSPGKKIQFRVNSDTPGGVLTALEGWVTRNFISQVRLRKKLRASEIKEIAHSVAKMLNKDDDASKTMVGDCDGRKALRLTSVGEFYLRSSERHRDAHPATGTSMKAVSR
jgi:hypothetical protein